MANIRLEAPERFDFAKPDDWPRWRKRFEHYRAASGLDKESEERQVSTLLYCLGDTADDVLTSTNITEEDRKKYDSVIVKFDDFFKVRKNVIFERAKFNRRNQLPGESAEKYITALYHLVETCDYGEFKEEMLRDRIVVGMRDIGLSERLQMDAKLTLDKVKRELRQKEAVQQQQQQLQAEPSARTETLESVDTPRRTHVAKGRTRGGKVYTRTSHNPIKGGANATADNSPSPVCKRCGKARHPPGTKCPASTAVCHKCNRKGHYQSQCFSKTVAATDEVELDTEMDTAFLGAVSDGTIAPWTVSIRVGDKEIPFKMDTGAQVSAISEKMYQKLKGVKLKKPSKALYGPARHLLNVIGQFTADLSYGQRHAKQRVYVVRDLQANLLGLPALIALQLLCRVNAVTKSTSDDDIIKHFPQVFEGLGNIGEEYTIRLKPNAVPYSLYTPRNIALPLREKVRDELNRMEAMGVITKVTEPTPWCAGMVIVPKRSGDVRICVDLKPLNECVLRETYPIPQVDETLAQLAGAVLFSKLDANCGFWQIPLSAESRQLTTFITPYGRYCFNKLPFGITSAPELFQRRMSVMLEGLPGVLCLMDDIIIYGASREEHDARLEATLLQLQAAGATLNAKKCEFQKTEMKFLGHIVSREGIRPDPDKTAALVNMEAPNNVSELRRFMGMANQMGKFSPRLAEVSQPLRELLSTKRQWAWDHSQERAFAQMKEELSKPTVLALYDSKAETKVSADASSYGLGAVLLQKSGAVWRPVAYASRALSDTEGRYAQIEKEALALTWACERFSKYLLGRSFFVETDHKPLVPLFSSKHLDNLPPRILRFRLRLAWYSFTISHVPGKLLYTADALSRSPCQNGDKNSKELEEEVETYISAIVSTLPATAQRLSQYRDEQLKDPVCALVAEYCRTSWPAKQTVKPELIPYWKVRGSLTMHDGLLLYDDRIVVPQSLWEETLQRVHEGHQGIERCRLRAKHSVWWPEIAKHLKEVVTRCPDCAKDTSLKKEPLMPTPLPEYPWQMISSDLFVLNGTTYLLVVDYYSRYPEVTKLSSTLSSSVIAVLKTLFARYGIPEILRSDNGPQYASDEFAQFMRSYSVEHITSSPRYPQSNGLVERMVQTVKRLLKRSRDPHLALLSYRSTPLPWCNLSPSELLMGRRLRTTLPQTTRQLIPLWPYLSEFKQADLQHKERTKEDFDRRHRVRDLPDLSDDQEVWVSTPDGPVPGTVVSPARTPRSYVVETRAGEVRRNRRQLRVVPEQEHQDRSSEQRQTLTRASPIQTRSRTGVTLRAPDRLA